MKKGLKEINTVILNIVNWVFILMTLLIVMKDLPLHDYFVNPLLILVKNHPHFIS